MLYFFIIIMYIFKKTKCACNAHEIKFLGSKENFHPNNFTILNDTARILHGI